MRILFALLLIIVGVAQITANAWQKPHILDWFSVRSAAGNLSEKYPMTEEDRLASAKAVQHVEYFRRFIHTGIGYVPTMDPYTREQMNPIHLGLPGAELTGTLELSNIAVSGGADFSVDNMEVYLKTHRIDFNLTIPELVADAHFSAVNMMYHDLMFNTSGDIEVVLNGYRVQGAVSVVANPSTGRYMSEGIEVLVSADAGSYITTTPINHPTDAMVVEVRHAVLDAMAEAALVDMTNVLGGYLILQVDTFMKP